MKKYLPLLLILTACASQVSRAPGSKEDCNHLAAAIIGQSSAEIDVLYEYRQLESFDRNFASLSQVHVRAAQQEYSLSDREILSLFVYQASAYRQINSALVKGDKSLEAVQFLVDDLKSALEKLPDFRNNVVRYANIPNAELEKYQVGAVVSYAGFMSTSQTTIGYFERPHYMQIKSKHGKAIGIIVGDIEHEVLFKPGTQLRVKSRTDMGGGKWSFWLEELD